MINLCSFRVGNAIMINGVLSNLSLLDLFSMYQMAQTGKKIVNFEPVALTDEMLLRLGFELIEFQETKDRVGYILDIANQTWFEGSGPFLTEKNKQIEINIRCRGSLLRKSCEYVHELQNLYYCIKDEELEINIMPY